VDKALRLYRTTCEDKRGKIVFLAGEKGSGKSAVMAALAKSLHPANAAHIVIRGKFVEGKYVPIPHDTNYILSDKTDAIGNVFAMLAKVLSLKTGLPIDLVTEGINFFFDFVGQLLQTGASLQKVIDDTSSKPPALGDLSDWLKRLLRTVAEKGPVLCLLEDFDQAERIEWSGFLNTFAEEIAADLPVMFVVSLRGGSDVGEYHPNQTHCEYLTRRLVKNDLAEWWHLKPTTQAEIAAWIHLAAAPEIISELHAVTGGIPRWIRELWREWKLRGAVIFDEGRQRWEWSEKNRPPMGLFKDVLEDRLKLLLNTDDISDIDAVREILGCAALEDFTFTADGLAITLNWERDELVDFLDDTLVQTESNPAGLLREEPLLQISSTPERYVCRYRFLSDWHWHVLDRYAFSEEQKKKRSAEMLTALQQAYDGAEHLVAKPLARLCRELNILDAAAGYEVMASFAGRTARMYQHALQLMAMNDEGWDRWQCENASKKLVLIGSWIGDTFSHRELIRLFDRAAELARRAKHDEMRAQALYNGGYANSAVGEYKVAKEKASLAFDLFTRIKDRRFVAATLNLLAEIYLATGEHDKAEESASKALKISERTRVYKNQSVSLRLLSQIALRRRNLDDAIDKGVRALKLAEKVGDITGKTLILGVLGEVESRRGAYDEAIEIFSESLGIAKQFGLKHSEAAMYYFLSDIYYSKKEYDESRNKALQALAMNTELEGLDVYTSSMHTLAKIDSHEGKYVEALTRVKELLAISIRLGNKSDEALSLYLLGEISLKKGQFDIGTRLCAIGYTILLKVRTIKAAEMLEQTKAVNGFSEASFNDAVCEATDKYGTSEFEISTSKLIEQAFAAD
jgi:tetratricopeptide (TPR) repeat protein/energy-coupling factor transporter ATP-binding protein EcfA2